VGAPLEWAGRTAFAVPTAFDLAGRAGRAVTADVVRPEENAPVVQLDHKGILPAHCGQGALAARAELGLSLEGAGDVDVSQSVGGDAQARSAALASQAACPERNAHG